MSENNRRHVRYDFQIDIVLTLTDNDPKTMKTRDISEGGMFIDTSSPSDFPLGEMVHIQYNDPLSDHAETEVDAIIVHIINDDGIGIAFIEIDTF